MDLEEGISEISQKDKYYMLSFMCGICWGFFSPGLGSDEPERMTLGQSLVRTDKFIFVVKFFYRSRNKELKVCGQQSAYGVNT